MRVEQVEQVAKAIAAALESAADVTLFGGYTDTDSLDKAVLDGRYDLVEVARALAEAGLLAPAPLREEWATHAVVEGEHYYYRWPTRESAADDCEGGGATLVHQFATDWLPVDRAEGDGSADT